MTTAHSRWHIRTPIKVLLVLALGVLALYALKERREPLRVGVLFSVTGSGSGDEAPMINATQLAIDELNARGGVLGRKIVPVVRDGCSDERVFAEQAEKLINDEHVAVIFGCWTSAARRAVTPIMEQSGNLLVYAMRGEGLESSPNVLCMGMTPNQQVIPAVRWSVDHIGPRLYLMGSDYIYSRTAHLMIRDAVNATGGTIVGETFLPLGATDAKAAVQSIQAAHPSVIINTMVGSTNSAFLS